MKLPKIPLAQTVIKLCELQKIKHIVISPGSRNAPLTIGFTNHPYFECYSIVDERCAAFFALGMAQQLRAPVAVVCTSGSALLNYYPAVAEAFYSDIPLIILSADRPKHLIGVGDGQTINQKGVYKNHILFEANLKEAINPKSKIAKDAPKIIKNITNTLETFTEIQKDIQTYNELAINQAIYTAISQKGPVHINIPFNEPLYEMVDTFSVMPKIQAFDIKDEQYEYESYSHIWNTSSKKLVLVGVHTPNTIKQGLLDALGNDPSVIVFTETTSNLHHDSFFPSIDKIIAPLEATDFEQLQPEVLLTFGGLIVSKKVKAFLRTYQPKHHWHVDEKRANDTFFCLEKHFKCRVNDFLENLQCVPVTSDYQLHWNAVKTHRNQKHTAYVNQIAFSDFLAFDRILKAIPDHTQIQCANSSTIRYLQLFDLNPTLQIFCNRGTSGIDGSTSTAIGAAVISNTPVLCITGDLSFFYDSNALWNTHIPPSFRIIVINNEGGGIFRILPGHKNTENFDQYFETKHHLKAMHLCAMYNFEYTSAYDEITLKETLNGFFEESTKPKLLEVFTPRQLNDEVLLNYFKEIK